VKAGPLGGFAKTLRAPVLLTQGTSFPFSVVNISFSRNAGINPSSLTLPFSQPPHLSTAGLPGFIKGEEHTQESNQYPANVFAICEDVAAAGVGVAVPCVLRGITFARIRVRDRFHRFAVPSQPRQNEQWVAARNGTLDSTDCECDGAARILQYGEGAALTVNSIYWAMILL
jgi:hypothetical protein